MAKFLDKTNVQTPVKRFRDFDLSCQQLTTAFFMRPTVAYAKEFPKCKIKCNLKSYARMQPLLKPVLGSVQVHNRAFYIPFRTVWSLWDYFLVNAPYNTPSGTMTIDSVPLISEDDLVTLFTDGQYLLATNLAASATVWDYQYSSTKYQLLPYGRHIMKVLNQLGYKINFDDKQRTFSALPLLCFTKAFFDWYFPAQYSHVGSAAIIDGMFQRNYTYTMSISDLTNIFDFIAWAYYGNDYFTAAFDTPTSPAAGGYSPSFGFHDETLVTASIGTNLSPVVTLASNGTPVINREVTPGSGLIADYVTNLTQYLDTALKKLNNYQRRHQLVGMRVLDRYLADFQTVPKWEQMKRSQFIGSQSFPIQFQDVMSNSDTISSSGGVTSGAQLGAFAGKGVAFDGNGDFVFDSDEFGYFIIINTIVPDVAYYQGLDRNVLHKMPFDFLSGEWEGLGTQAVRKAELRYGFNDGQNQWTDIYGFLPRYAEYKCGRDLVTGLYLYNTQNAGLLAWSTVRTVANGQAHGLAFLRGDDAWQYARIFYGNVTGPESELDKFFFVHRVNIKVSMQASPLYDVYDFDEEEGEEIKMQVNGAQF